MLTQRTIANAKPRGNLYVHPMETRPCTLGSTVHYLCVL
jgi:hypothetical protein